MRRVILWAIVVGALGVFVWTLIHAVFYAPETEIQVPSLARTAPATKVATSSLPARLIIPSIGINAAIQNAGINAQGNMQVPSNFTDVAWYKYGAVPGQVGSAVIDGHVDNGLGLDGVFKHLADVNVGDDVFVQTRGGQQLHFVVTDIEVYPYTQAPSLLIFGQKDAARLNLITCDGTWVKGKDTYNERLVVFTRLVT
ncbi:MAG TPA: class F sortase [Candidatus Paceibacterota bacterium]|nr:class F sortase [Candidatus Paceibacterota bacterium]